MKQALGQEKTRWHRLLGKVLEEWLTPVNIGVQVEFPVLSNPPQADILLLRREGAGWSEAQRERLADGLRHSRASRLLLEFKYTQSFNEEALAQLLAYDTLYRSAQSLKKGEVESFLLSSRAPRRKTLETLGYEPSAWAGVYQSSQPLAKRARLISLNELADTPWNATLKCFASQRQQRASAFECGYGARNSRASRFPWNGCSPDCGKPGLRRKETL